MILDSTLKLKTLTLPLQDRCHTPAPNSIYTLYKYDILFINALL